MPITAKDILDFIRSDSYRPVKLKQLAKRMEVDEVRYRQFRDTVKGLVRSGKLAYGKNRVLEHDGEATNLIGTFHPARAGFGFVRPQNASSDRSRDIYIPKSKVGDAAAGDQVLVRLTKKRHAPGRNSEGRIVEIIERATNTFVGTYFEAGGGHFVQVDGNLFSDPIAVGDPGAKKVRKKDKVVIEMIRFPSRKMSGEAVISEVLGAKGEPGVDTLSIIREFDLHDRFEEDVLSDALAVAQAFENASDANRVSFKDEIVVTIDPADARDFDDAIHIKRLPSGNWELGVHIADVSYFVQPKTALDREARKRATSVYLPDRVLPMLPETLSNGVASLQQGVRRFTKSVVIEFNETGTRLNTQVHSGVICVTHRFDYESVMDFLNEPEKHEGEIDLPVRELLGRMQELASILRQRRRSKGFLELDLPEVKLELHDNGEFQSAVLSQYDESHQIIEEFMLSANEAVAEFIADHEIPFLRRVHGDPDPLKLVALAEFARAIGYEITRPQSRDELQELLRQADSRTDRYAIHYGLLRSMKRAEYSPEQIGHYAIASDCYCHFTSPIRRYPDLVIHRLLTEISAGRKPKGKKTMTDLLGIGEHCTDMERRAAGAEAELIKVKVLKHLSQHIGLKAQGVITSVESFGFYVQIQGFWIEGLVHVSSLVDDFYRFDNASHSLTAQGSGRSFKLGDTTNVVVTHVDLDRRHLDLRVSPKDD